jgi:hypothetical protein
MIDNLTPKEALELSTGFLALASAGRRGTASTGERAAFRILNQLRALSADWEDIDPSARLGASVVLEMLSNPDLRPIIARRLS